MFSFRPNYIAKYIIISLDFDGVLAHGLNAKLKYAKKWFNLDLSLSQTKKEGFEKLVKKLGKQLNYRSLMDPLNEEHIMEYELPLGCLQILEKLYSEGFRFVIITARNNHDSPYAVEFVKHKLGHLIKNIHNTRNESKNKFVKLLKPRVHIDDTLENLIELQNENVHLGYYRQPENEHINFKSNERIQEINSWNEFYVFCQKIKLLHEAICWKYDLENNYHHNELLFNFLRKLHQNTKNQLLKEYSEFKHGNLSNFKFA